MTVSLPTKSLACFKFSLLLLGTVIALPTEAADFVQLRETSGQHHFVGADGTLFFALGINHVGALSRTGRPPLENSSVVRGTAAWETYWQQTLKPQFEEWNVNTLGYDLPTELRSKTSWFATNPVARIEKHRSHPNANDPNHYHFPDVFDPAWAKETVERISRVVAATRSEPNLIGHFWTDTPTWNLHKTRALRGTDWVSEIRKRPVGSPGHTAYVAFLKTRYADRLDELNLIYSYQLKSLDDLDSMPFEHVPIGRHLVHEDDSMFLGQIAKRYYSIVGTAYRETDPNHLVFGDRFLVGDSPENVLRAIVPWVDAIAVQPGDRYTPLMPPSTAFPADELDTIHRVTQKPILICDHAISFPTAAMPRTIFEQAPSEEAAAEATLAFLDAAFSKPYIVGYLRCQYIDRPAGFGRGLRQGLVRADGSVRKTLVDAYSRGFADATARLAKVVSP